LDLINWFLKLVENRLKKDVMFGPKTCPRGPSSPYVLNHNDRSAYAVYILTVCVYIYHPRRWIIGPSPRPVNQLSQPRAPDRADRLLMPRPTPHAPDRADQPRAPSAPCNSAIFWFEAVILLQWTQPFCYSKLNHFVRHSWDFFSVILLQWTHPFTIVLSHFVILSNILEIFAQSICYSEFNHFVTVLGYFGISSAFCYNELIHFATGTQPFCRTFSRFHSVILL
jgi:hypothetical protein